MSTAAQILQSLIKTMNRTCGMLVKAEISQSFQQQRTDLLRWKIGEGMIYTNCT